MILFEDSDGLEPVSTDTLTPMIDVILSLIAFMMLMINAPLLTMNIDLPEINNDEYSAPSETKLITLDVLEQAEHWRLGDIVISSDEQLKRELTRQVLDATDAVSTVISIDQHIASQRLIDTLDILKQLGIEDADIALEKTTGGTQ